MWWVLSRQKYHKAYIINVTHYKPVALYYDNLRHMIKQTNTILITLILKPNVYNLLLFMVTLLKADFTYLNS